MSTQRLTIEDDPSPADVRVLEDALYRHNVQQTGRDDGRWLAIFVRDADGKIVAGLNGWTWAGWLKVANLWIHEDRRRQRLGRQLLTAAEKEAVARGCTRATLDTFSFQALDFYRKLGYTIVSTLEDFPAGHSHYTLIKRL
jgi:ribosomal protein S18 acetylase RimI-like enzyme